MSKLFFDKLVELKEIDKLIKSIAQSPEEREELWAIVDEIIHHKVMGCILDRLPRADHEEFLQIYHASPHDEVLIFDYLKTKVGIDIEEQIKEQIDSLNDEILKELSLPPNK